MKRVFIPIILILALASMACSITGRLPGTIRTGDTQTLTLNEPLPGSGRTSPYAVSINMGAGTLKLAGGAQGLLEGTIQYNIADWEPTIDRTDARLRIEQENISGIPVNSDVENDWDLRLNNDLPMDLEINAGAYNGEMDLGGLRLTDLRISDGASKTVVNFQSPNPEAMDTFRYSTGASDAELHGLGNANFSRLVFESGAGKYVLDFTGSTLQRDAEVQIKSGVSNVTLVVPEGMRVRVTVDSALNNIDTTGTWNVSNGTYTTEGAGPLLTVEVEMGVGNLELEQR